VRGITGGEWLLRVSWHSLPVASADLTPENELPQAQTRETRDGRVRLVFVGGTAAEQDLCLAVLSGGVLIGGLEGQLGRGPHGWRVEHATRIWPVDGLGRAPAPAAEDWSSAVHESLQRAGIPVED
jgi:hypothetical protein